MKGSEGQGKWRLYITEQGAGQVSRADDEWTLSIPHAERSVYSNAQISTYASRADFIHAPPARIELTAHAQGEIRGTAGFGFWNHPYGRRLRDIRLPRAVWFFFASPPSDMALAKDVSGHGWKAATFDAQRWPFLALLPVAPVGILLMRVPALYRALWPVGQWALGVDELALDPTLLHEPHRYVIDWQRDRVTFEIDGKGVFSTRHSPSGRLGFVAWIDNQYAVVTPQGRFGSGLVDVDEPQTLAVRDVTITR